MTHGLCDGTDRGTTVLGCIAAVAPDRRDVFKRVAAAARPAPPEMRRVEGYEQYSYDATMHRRGVAIDALGHFAAFAGDAVPILVDALETFEEYDPDWGYENGEHG